MPRPILPGFTYDRASARFRDTARGQFVSRTRIMFLLEAQVNSTEQRLGEIVTAMHEGAMSSGYGQMLMRDELRRLNLTNAALGKGGFDRLDFRDYGRAGRQLRDTYERISNLARDMEAGRVTLPQALNRVRGYVGEARRNFFASERDAMRATGRAFEERRRLNPAEHCKDCVRYASMSWRQMGELPVPGEGSVCGPRCRCTMERREVTPEMMRERMTARLERMMAT